MSDMIFSEFDIHCMQRAFHLASLGRGAVSPNPMVGCVITFDHKIIGEGFHTKYGMPHAEVEAINSVENKTLLKEATVYVTLEPCSHFGKTPPCADLLIKHQVKKVIIASLDPNPLVAGKGVEKLEKAGIEVLSGLLKEEGAWFNRRFFHGITQNRPYVILKWAETADGFVARSNYDSKWISGVLSRQKVHQWRAEEDAVLVGKNTARYDDPALTVREWNGRNPVRVVIDRNLSLPKDLKLFDQSEKTIVYNLLEEKKEGENLVFRKVSEASFLEDMLNDLYVLKIQSIIVEGGGWLLGALIKQGLWDEIRQFQSTVQTFEKGIEAPLFRGQLLTSEKIEDDWLRIFKQRGV